jgi:hypothetical protein
VNAEQPKRRRRFLEDIPHKQVSEARVTDVPAKGWRVLDDSGNMQDYSVRPDARRAMYDAPGSSAVYGRTRSGVWRLDETLLREG